MVIRMFTITTRNVTITTGTNTGTTTTPTTLDTGIIMTMGTSASRAAAIAMGRAARTGTSPI